MHLDWDKLRVFLAVAEAGSHTHAEETLHISQSAISRQITALEDQIGASLFQRHARGLILTEQGEHLLRSAKEIQKKVLDAQTQIEDSIVTPTGELRVTTTIAFGISWLSPRLHSFCNAFPNVNLHLHLTNEYLDLASRKAEVALRFEPAKQANIIQSKLMTFSLRAYASKQYIKKFGEPKSLQDLDNHRLIAFGDDAISPVPQINWILTRGRTRNNHRVAYMEVNNNHAIRFLLQNGMGIGTLPSYMLHEQWDLVEVLKDIDNPLINIYLAYPEEIKRTQRLRVFREFLLEQASEWNQASTD